MHSADLSPTFPLIRTKFTMNLGDNLYSAISHRTFSLLIRAKFTKKLTANWNSVQPCDPFLGQTVYPNLSNVFTQQKNY